ncbi:MAG: hypothetical protein DWQ47_11900 [Acidobacteria bacterium]|nr:MAG: hypothetical protein DWQ32_14315 [Acidobacteriota bacterium]REJ98274.1 MAG: hypothetical protein DWQ38_17115 [Acidobacteriota bacterium]REK17018.1 MAG: hypothetical protein DWQ43_02160 [Acidobacteriota bacterium]REK42928.1 MAG: hypothetical protein DWQ47_11900 [Acidobacteriota bacterium]
MKIKAIPFAIATALTAVILWVVCSVLVFAMPDQMMGMSGNMIHANLSEMRWDLSITGLMIGLIAWGVFAGVFGWFLAVVYNLLNK